MVGDRRSVIESVALELLDSGGPAALTTRAVCAGAGVQPMTIYRLYGDMEGLMTAAVRRGYDAYIRAKTDRERHEDPVEDLRSGWDLHVGFGLAHPHVYAQIYGRYAPDQENPAADAAAAILRSLLERAARHGRLTRNVETAAHIIHSAGCGFTLSQMRVPAADRDPGLSTVAREAALAAVTTDGATAGSPVRTAAVALAAAIDEGDPRFSAGERLLLTEWLARLS
ncbi:TetR/AcrR family transcriptional regulator [Actinoplanes rectilineatus]|uniref:TetR/AcrR family transcriptional regulator n=1 Tax=Actinoplanes rectilineatus TaxID=113571 RepID=UPI0005F281B5|nr:TetR/AcrR family transcriptional regulator [Actinoplanes rectilineatus]